MNPTVIDANLARAVIAAGEASAKSDRVDCFFFGLAFAGLVFVGLTLSSTSRSSLDWTSSVHLGSIPQPSEKPILVPSGSVIAPLTNPLVSEGWRG